MILIPLETELQRLFRLVSKKEKRTNAELKDQTRVVRHKLEALRTALRKARKALQPAGVGAT